jgi:dienelactone hydrolase
VLALLAKPLDWCTIQLARRSLSPAARAAGEEIQPLPEELGDLCPAVVVPATDFVWTSDGAFRFRSPLTSTAMENNTVYGRLFAAGEDWRRHPTAILLHGWNAELCYRKLFPKIAAHLKQVGWNTADIELPYHMRRRPRQGPVTDFISSDLGGMLAASRQALADIAALGRWLQAQGSLGIGLWGFSLGAWLAGLMARTDAGLRFVVLTTPIARIDRVVHELPFCEPIRRGLRGRELDLTPLNLGAQKTALDPGKMLIIQARHDLFAPAATVEELWRAWGQPEIWRVPQGHISVLMSMSLVRRAAHWIERLS